MSTSPFMPHPDPFLGRVLKETYHLDRKLDENGAGAVYIGTHLGSDRTVAVKTLQGLRKATPEICARFFHEARILSRLNHPNIVELLDFDFTPEGLPFLVMGYMEGCTLDAFVPEGGLPFRTVVDFLRQILSGVGAAHEARLVHRDLSPYNLFVADPAGSPTIKVLNFGVAKALNDSGAKTFGNQTFGNPNYMSPEHFRNFEGMDARADIFSLGSVLYFLITGQEAFPGLSFSGVMAKVLTGQKPAPIDFHALGKPEAAVLEPIIRRAMDLEPELRFASTDEMREALREALAHQDTATGAPRKARFRPFPLRSVATFALGASPLFLLTGGFIAWQLSQPGPSHAPMAAPRSSATPEGVFQVRLHEVVKARDAKALLALVDADARIGGAKGPEGFQAAWRPEDPTSPLWTELAEMLDRGADASEADRFQAHTRHGDKDLRLSASRAADGIWHIDGFGVE